MLTALLGVAFDPAVQGQRPCNFWDFAFVHHRSAFPTTVAQRVLASLRIPEAITNSATGFLQPTGLQFSLGEAIVPSSRTPVTQDTHYTFGCPSATFMDQTTTRAHPPLVKISPLQLLSRSKAHCQQAGPVTSDRTCVLRSTLSPYT